jgi:hypothetical protein
MKDSLKLPLIVVVLLPVLFGCALVNQIKDKLESFNKPQLITASDG